MGTDQVDDRLSVLPKAAESSFEIVYVKFRFSGRRHDYRPVPNCAIASAEECPSAKSKFLGEANQLAGTTRGRFGGEW